MTFAAIYTPPLTLNYRSTPIPVSSSSSCSSNPCFAFSSCHRRLRVSPFPVLCFSSSEMDAAPGQTLYPLHRSKTIHLVRHAQGIHNVEGEKDHNAYLSYDLFDAHLTPLGWAQVDDLHKHVQACGLSKKIELVITSPLLRTMQTAVGVFGGGAYTDGINAPPLMVANAGSSDRSAITSLNCPPFIAVELCRERFVCHVTFNKGCLYVVCVRCSQIRMERAYILPSIFPLALELRIEPKRPKSLSVWLLDFVMGRGQCHNGKINHCSLSLLLNKLVWLLVDFVWCFMLISLFPLI